MLLIGKRILQLIVVFVCVTFFTVLLISMVPGKPEVVVIPFDSTGHRPRGLPAGQPPRPADRRAVVAFVIGGADGLDPALP